MVCINLKAAPLHRDLSGIGYMYGEEAETGSMSSMEMVIKRCYRLRGRKGSIKGGSVGGEGGGGGGGEKGRGKKGERDNIMSRTGKCSN